MRRAPDRHAFAGHDAGDPSLEARILSDADGLDAMGAIGIARAFMYGGLLGEPMWDPEAPVADRYEPGRATSVVHHFYDKLLRLSDDMRTGAGARHARERHAFLETFLERFHAEWAGVPGEARR